LLPAFTDRQSVYEWDDNIPSFEEVHGEALKANRFLASAQSQTMAADIPQFEEVHP
jgi:uncharacterized protein